MHLGSYDWTVDLLMVDPVLQTIAGLLTLLISVFLYLRLLFRSRQGNRTFKVAFLHPNW